MESFNCLDEKDMSNVTQIYDDTINVLNQVLVGQARVKKVVASAILSDTNSRILFTGNTGMGKTTLANFLASGFKSEKISVTSDLLPSDIQEQLKKCPDLSFLYIDEFNRANGKVQSSFGELLEENQMTINGVKYSFKDFYVLATQNSADISGIFNVPQNIYDRFDINVFFDELSEAEMRLLLFGGFKSLEKNPMSYEDIRFTKRAVDNFILSEDDINLMMKIFNIIDALMCNGKKMFAGSNIRAHMFAIKLAKFNAIINGRNYILPVDVSDFINYLYMHRVDQNVVNMNNGNLQNIFYDTEQQILNLKRTRKR